ncbi:MAG: hypothetical protein HC945_01075 [Nitrosarchaeum sp.]|nr:hypothetical protein [Nitrosarchaeum sp.]
MDSFQRALVGILTSTFLAFFALERTNIVTNIHPTWLPYAITFLLIILIVIIVTYYIIPTKGDIELIPQPGQIFATPEDTGTPKPPEPKERTRLRAYIRSQIAKGNPLPAIGDYLIAAGWDKETIRKEIDKARQDYSNMINT